MKTLFQLLPALLAVGVGGYALFRGTDVFSALTDGALQGLRTVGRIAPVLVCLLPAVGALRASGAIDAFTALLRPALSFLGIPPETVPLMLLRPMSGSGALAVAGDIFTACGADSPAGRTAAVMLGSTETTFYVLSVYFSALTAYAIYAYDFKFKNAAFTIILLIMTMPMQVSALGFLRLMDNMHLTNTLWPLILPSIAAPTVFFFMKQYMDSSLPKELIEAARIDGSGEFHTFNVIILPILKPAVAVQAIFSFVGSWNNYFTPALIISDAKWKTVPILIAQLRGADFLKFDMGKVYLMIALAILPVIIVYLILSKYIVRGIALGSVKG